MSTAGFVVQGQEIPMWLEDQGIGFGIRETEEKLSAKKDGFLKCF